MRDVVLEVKNLTVRIGARRVLDDVSFSVFEGEVLALVGESGSGKTMSALSILDILPGTAQVEKGKVIFEGKDLLSLGRKEIDGIRGSRISMVFQEPSTAFNPVMRIGEQISEVLAAHKTMGNREIAALVWSLLEKVRLPADTALRYPHELSGGMRQRAMLAMAVACSPSVLILDEPTTALDVTIQKHVLDLISRIQKAERLATLFITHDFSIVNMIADRVCVMKEGRVVETGARRDILEKPRHPYTRQLIACIPRIGDTRERLPVVEG